MALASRRSWGPSQEFVLRSASRPWKASPIRSRLERLTGKKDEKDRTGKMGLSRGCLEGTELEVVANRSRVRKADRACWSMGYLRIWKREES
jgi:hypothetical protein